MSDRSFPSFYRALNPDVNEIRLLTNISVDVEDRVSCRLITVPIHKCPPYAALSYVWGEDTDLVPIQVDGQAFQATPSLAKALRYIPQHWETRYPGRALAELRVWADAICINQRDPEERARQVQLMGTIFSGAELVMCWVVDGKLDQDLDYEKFSGDIQDDILRTAFRTIELINRELRLVEQEVGVNTLSDVGLSDKRLVQWLAKHPELVEITPVNEWTIWNMNWEAVYLLSWNQYWERVWIFQELVLAKEALLICKSSCISLTDAVNRVWLWFDLLESCSLSNPSFLSPILWQSLVSGRAVMKWKIALSLDTRRWMSMGRPEKLWILLPRAILLTATDPKDKLYGMLSITGIDLRPDYSDQTSIARVFRDMTAAWLQDYESTKEDAATDAVGYQLEELWFLTYAGLVYNCDHVSCQQFSSWAPNVLHYEHSANDYRVLNEATVGFGVFSDDQSRVLSYIQGSSLFVTGIQVNWAQETYPHVCKASDIFAFVSDLFRKEASEFSRVESKRRFLRDFFELLFCWKLPISTINARPHISDPNSIIYLEYACAFIWAVLNANSKRKRDCTATALSNIPTFSVPPQYRTAMETMGLISDTDAGFLLSLRQIFLDIENVSEQDLGETSGSDYEHSPLSWLQELMGSAATGGLPKGDKLAACCQWIVKDLEFTLECGVLFRTSRGDFGIAPRKTINRGDVLCVLKGYSSTVALRETGDHFLFVGETKVQGMMEGQAAQLLKEGQAEVRQFELK